ncbi:MAG: hypothetical protein ABIL17_08595 [candidate division WOR-3 bacterium]
MEKENREYSVLQAIQKAREALERETFDPADIKRVFREAFDEFENIVGATFRDLGRIIRQRYPIAYRNQELLSKYTFLGKPSYAPDSATLVITVDNSGGTTPMTPIIQGLFAPAPFVNISPSANITITLNGTRVADAKYLSDIVLRQSARVEAIRFIKDGGMTLAEFHAINVRYELYGIWGNRQDLETFSLGQYAKEDNFKDTPLTVARGLVLDGNTGISLLNFPPVPAGQVRTFTLVLYISGYSSPGLHLGGEKPIKPKPTPKPSPIRHMGPAASFDEYEEEEEF